MIASGRFQVADLSLATLGQQRDNLPMDGVHDMGGVKASGYGRDEVLEFTREKSAVIAR